MFPGAERRGEVLRSTNPSPPYWRPWQRASDHWARTCKSRCTTASWWSQFCEKCFCGHAQEYVCSWYGDLWFYGWSGCYDTSDLLFSWGNTIFNSYLFHYIYLLTQDILNIFMWMIFKVKIYKIKLYDFINQLPHFSTLKHGLQIPVPKQTLKTLTHLYNVSICYWMFVKVLVSSTS